MTSQPVRIAACVLVSLCLLLLTTMVAFGQGRSEEHRPIVMPAVKHDVSPPLREIPRRSPRVQPNRQIPNKLDFRPVGPGAIRRNPDPLWEPVPSEPALLTPGPLAGFPGLSDVDNQTHAGGRVVPPDTQGDVGPNHFIQMINLLFAVYNKDGTYAVGGEPRANSDLWSGFGGVCEELNNGDPIVLYDHLADRWVFSQFALGEYSLVIGEADGHQCIAVSQTSDPLGPWDRYDFVVSPSQDGGYSIFAINDYPKMGVWPDGYYLSANEFQCEPGFLWLPPTCYFVGVRVAVFERSVMLAGGAARMINFDNGLSPHTPPLPCTTSDCPYSLQPSHLEGPAPPEGTPNTFLMAFDDDWHGTGSGVDRYRLWEFEADWDRPGNSTLTEIPSVQAVEFDAAVCSGAECVPQLNGELLDTLSDFTMYRVQFRQFAEYQTIVVNHTVDVDGNNLAGIRWAELRRIPGEYWEAHQEGTFAPGDGLHRWMGSIAMDGAGNIALGYSASSAATYPSVRYTARAAEDPPGVMGSEEVMKLGGGAQTSSSNRWGDYSALSVDPADDCTFWYTQEYYESTGSFDFNTWIGSFRLPGCGIECATDGDCDDGIPCTADSCNLASGLCQNTPDDLSCDDGLFCNGLEICGAGGCEVGTPSGCDDGVSCTDDSCNEATDSCDHVSNDANCDNALFCDGTETCDPVNDCQPGADPCPIAQCDEVNDVCEGCDNDGTCESGEDCDTCPNDCVAGTSSGAVCGNQVCEAANGEDCISCPADCNGVQTGRPANRYCCGPDICGDSVCNAGGNTCSLDLVEAGSYCCGQNGCEPGESSSNCALDCGSDPCGDGTCDPLGGETCTTCEADCGPCLTVDCTLYADKWTCNAQATCRWDNKAKSCIGN